MTLTVSRHLIPIVDDRPEVHRILWQHDGVSARSFGDVTPAGYVPGLLRGELDGRVVDLAAFDRALADLELTRASLLVSVSRCPDA